jgi:uncharacterized repeat protein (TIGR03943 family)
MSRVITRWLTPCTLLAWGAVFTGTYFTGGVLRLLHPAFRELSAAAGITLIALALLWPFVAGGSCGDEHHDHSHDEVSPLRGVLRAFILVAPVVACLLVNPTGFSAVALRNREEPGGIRLTAPPSAAVQAAVNASTATPADATAPIVGDAILEPEPAPANTGEALDATLSDLHFLADEAKLREEFKGRLVKVVGQVSRESSSSGRYRLTRMVMWCCAADARPLAVGVTGDPGAQMQDMAWVEVTGRIQFEMFMGKPVPAVIQSSVRPVDAPAEAFLFN